MEGFDATERVQALAGASDPKIARTTDVGSWRARFGVDRTVNVVSTPRHAKGAQRTAAFFFGPRQAAAAASPPAPPVAALALRQPRRLVVLLTHPSPSPAQAACALLLRMQGAGLALHRAMRLDRARRDALGVSRDGDDAAPRVAFLLSREGDAPAFAARALSSGDAVEDSALGASLVPCAPDVASAVLTAAGAAPCQLADMYRFTAFQVKNEML